MNGPQQFSLPTVFSLFALSAVVSCSASTAPDRLSAIAEAPADFQTDAPSYTLSATSVGYEGSMAVTYTNRTANPANFVNCRGGTGVVLQKLVDGEWKNAYSPPLLACLSAPIVVAPGGQHQFTIPVFAGYPGNNIFPKWDLPEIPGTYRAVWTNVVTDYQDRLPFGNPLPIEHRVSNQFTIAVQPRPA